MSKRIYIALAVLAVVIAIAVLVLGPARRNDTPQRMPAAVVENEPAGRTAAAPASNEKHEPVAVAPEPAQSTAPEETVTAQSNDKTFRVSDSGRLVLDAQTRLNMEALFARTEREHLAEAKQQAIEPLPAAAAAEARDLLARYDNYQQAQRQTYPPGIAPATEEAALAELDGLHALRVAHFGPLVARALYGEEEAMSRQLIELMRLEKDQSLTMEEKAARAQQLHDQMQLDRR